jgi:hypothetical protein
VTKWQFLKRYVHRLLSIDEVFTLIVLLLASFLLFIPLLHKANSRQTMSKTTSDQWTNINGNHISPTSKNMSLRARDSKKYWSQDRQMFNVCNYKTAQEKASPEH